MVGVRSMFALRWVATGAGRRTRPSPAGLPTTVRLPAVRLPSGARHCSAARSLRQLDSAAFDKDPRAEFERIAGGRPRSRDDYGDLGARGKRALLWDFFESSFATQAMKDAKTIYSGVEKGVKVSEMLRLMSDGTPGNDVHSIEHVLPKSQLKEQLASLPRQVVNGSTINPLNFVPSHRGVNSLRGNKLFDFEGDAVNSDTLRTVDNQRRKFEAGVDSNGEWVPPVVSRGDVARCVVYMVVLYGMTDYVTSKELRVLQRWMKDDPPSEYEKAFGRWLQATRPLGLDVQNPFVSNTELVTDDAMFDTLVSRTLNLRSGDGSQSLDDPPPSLLGVKIDSVLPNVDGYDTPGTEEVTLHNQSDATIKLAGWTLVVEVPALQDSKWPWIKDLNDISLPPRSLYDVTFEKGNVLPNKQRTVITLYNRDNAVESTFAYFPEGPDDRVESD